MKKFLIKYRYQLVLFLIVALLFFINRRGDTYLSGWDNLQTELNPGLGVKRAFFSVWEEYQSFGLTAGMAHAADLVRSIFVWAISFILPQSFVRYFYHFAMLLIGSLGAFTLFGLMGIGSLDAFIGALFYLLNLGTIQIFYLPYESFSTFFAFLPWGIWIFSKLLTHNQHDKEKRKDWVIFFLINLLGTPSFYTQQLFLVYGLILGLMGISHFIIERRSDILKKSILMAVVITIINSFWILPQIYFVRTNVDWVSQNKASQISTEDTLYQNLEKGTLNNFVKLEGFYFDLSGIKNEQLFLPWKDHFFGPGKYFMTFLGFLALIGLIYSLKKKNSIGITLILLLCSIALMSATPPFSWINELLRQNTLVNQMFRSPFTKFVIIYSLIYSYFIAQGFAFLNQLTNKKIIIAPVVVVIIVLYALPAFKGYMISPEMQVKIPQDYFQVMDYFQNQPKDQRIAIMPDYTYWGWFFNKWGYNGSGFLWYGIEQPTVSRTFDGWSSNSESYFWEIKQATELEDINRYEKVLDKYDIDYLLIDYSLMPVASSYKSLALDRVDELIAQSQRISPILRTQNLGLYKIINNDNKSGFIRLLSNPTKVSPAIKVMTDDRAYEMTGDYINTKDAASSDIYLPFADLTTLIKDKEKDWSISESEDYFSLSSSMPNQERDLIMATQSAALLALEKGIDDVKLNLRTSKIDDRFNVDFEKHLIKSFDLSGYDKDLVEFSLPAPNLPQKYGYLIKIRSKNISGEQLFFYVTDDTKNQSVIEEKLRSETEYFILSPKFQYGLGYTLAFQNKSFDNYKALNELTEVSVYLFPYKELKNAHFISSGKKEPILTEPTDFEVEKNNYFFYRFWSPSQSDYLALSQSYDPGWLALSDGKILEHVKVNNWANGWKLDNQSNNVTIVYWPQFLEFIGFILLGLLYFRILTLKK